MKRRVLFVTPDFPPTPGGIQTLVHSIVSALERYQPHVVAPAEPGGTAFDRQLSFAVTRVRSPARDRRVRNVALNAGGLAAALRLRPDVIVSAHIVVGPAALAARRLRGIPVVQYVHAQELNRRSALARRVLPRANATVAVSRHTRDLALRLGAPEARVHVVHPGVDSIPEAERRGVRDNSIVVVSRLEERYKGHDVLLRALPLVRSRVPEAHLHVVGDGVMRGYLEALASSFGVADATTFHGRLPDHVRNDLMRRTSVFAMPSRTDALGSGEGFGIVYVEAGARGVPVVAGRVAGALDAVVDGGTGLLVDPEDHVAVADAITSILQDPGLAKRMGDEAVERARALSWQRAARELETVLDRMTAR